jgi:hypothetical protein
MRRCDGAQRLSCPSTARVRRKTRRAALVFPGQATNRRRRVRARAHDRFRSFGSGVLRAYTLRPRSREGASGGAARRSGKLETCAAARVARACARQPRARATRLRWPRSAGLERALSLRARTSGAPAAPLPRRFACVKWPGQQSLKARCLEELPHPNVQRVRLEAAALANGHASEHDRTRVCVLCGGWASHPPPPQARATARRATRRHNE